MTVEHDHKCIFDHLPAIFHNDFFMVIIHLLFFWLLISFANFLIEKFTSKIMNYRNDIEFTKQLNTLKLLFKSIADFVLISFAVMYILNMLGVDIRPILTAAGIVGVAVGFGAKRFVEDLITGLLIMLEGQIRVGDVIEVNGMRGTVEKLNIKLVVLRAVDGKVYYIRNGMIDIVTNLTRDYSYAMVSIGVAYKENIAKVIDVIKELGKEFKENSDLKQYVIAPIEVLGLDEFGDSAVIVRARLKTKPMYQWEVQRAFNLKLKERFDELGIEIPFPQVTVHNAEE